ncbi:gamma carbonic anhydrase family protein [Bradyrhizobium sp. 14AA]
MPVYALDGVSPTLPEPGTFWIAPGAHVIGNVRIGRDVGIWFGAVLRGDNELLDIGDGSNIQEGALLHSDPGFPLVIGPGVTIGHHAIVHGSKLGSNVLVGMGATILNGAQIGANSLVGAQALVTEGKSFPDGSLIVGSPAKAVRQLDEKTIASLQQSALNYVSNWRRHASSLHQID